MKSVLRLFKIFSTDVDKPDSSEDIYPKFRIVNTRDGKYKVEILEGNPYASFRYTWYPMATYRWLWQAKRWASNEARIAVRKHMQNKKYKHTVVWGPEP